MEKHQYFSEVTFGRSYPVLTPDYTNIYHIWNVQFKETSNPNNTLKGPNDTLDEIAEQFGAFMKEEFKKAIMIEEDRIRMDWEKGEKVVVMHADGSKSTSLKDEKKTEYHEVSGMFAPVGLAKE